MKQIGNYNKLPEGFKAPDPLKKGQKVTYKLMDDFKRPDPARPGKFLYPHFIQIPPTDEIVIDGYPYQIGMVTRIDKDGLVQECETFEVYSYQDGEFELDGNKAEHQKWYWYFELCNYNKGKEGRDEEKQAYFYRVDKEGDAVKEVKRADMELECLIFIKSQTPSEIKKLAAAFTINENLSEAEIRKELIKRAKNNPEEFSKLATSKEVETKATIQRAFDKGVINYVTAQHKVVWGNGGSTIATLPRVEGANWQDQFHDWVKTHKNGEATYKNIVKLFNEPVEAE